MYFNCCARGNSLYGIPGIDSAYIRQALGDFPLIGMFGGYELAPLGRANHLFAYTGVLALVTESGIAAGDFGLSERDPKIELLAFHQSKIENPKWSDGVEMRLASDALAFVVEVVDDDVVAHLIGRGVEDAAGIEPRELVDKSLPVKIRAEHKSIDLDAALRAALHFFQRFVNDATVQQRRAPAAVQAGRRDRASPPSARRR